MWKFLFIKESLKFLIVFKELKIVSLSKFLINHLFVKMKQIQILEKHYIRTTLTISFVIQSRT